MRLLHFKQIGRAPLRHAALSDNYNHHKNKAFLLLVKWGYGKKGPGKKGPGKKGPVKTDQVKTVQVKTVLGKNGPGKKGPTGYKGVK